jgi:hypothetical protein
MGWNLLVRAGLILSYFYDRFIFKYLLYKPGRSYEIKFSYYPSILKLRKDVKPTHREVPEVAHLPEENYAAFSSVALAALRIVCNCKKRAPKTFIQF